MCNNEAVAGAGRAGAGAPDKVLPSHSGMGCFHRPPTRLPLGTCFSKGGRGVGEPTPPSPSPAAEYTHGERAELFHSDAISTWNSGAFWTLVSVEHVWPFLGVPLVQDSALVLGR